MNTKYYMNGIGLRGERGFSMLEAMFAVLVLALGLVALARFQATLVQSSGDTKARTEAINLAQEKIEEMRNLMVATDLSGVNSSDSTTEDTIVGVNSTFTRSWTITSNTSPNYKTVKVTIAWQNNKDVAQSLDLESYINFSSPKVSAKLMEFGDDPTVNISATTTPTTTTGTTTTDTTATATTVTGATSTPTTSTATTTTPTTQTISYTCDCFAQNQNQISLLAGSASCCTITDCEDAYISSGGYQTTCASSFDTITSTIATTTTTAAPTTTTTTAAATTTTTAAATTTTATPTTTTTTSTTTTTAAPTTTTTTLLTQNCSCTVTGRNQTADATPSPSCCDAICNANVPNQSVGTVYTPSPATCTE